MTVYPSHAYEATRRQTYWSEENGTSSFVPVCSRCGRYVKADQTLYTDANGQPVGPNARCWRCGRVAMIFEGYI